MDNLFNSVAQRRRRGQGGFTLIELLVVIAVLAILAAIVIFNVVGVSNRGKQSACDTDVKTTQTALDAYYNDNNQTWTGVSSGDITPAEYNLLIPAYMHTKPASTLTLVFSNGTDNTQGYTVKGTTATNPDANGC